MTGPLAPFTAPTREWFSSVFPAPTAVQEEAWRSIAEGRHSLVVAPTGSGKTLAAFLWAIDALADESEPQPGTRILYVSPLKALGGRRGAQSAGTTDRNPARLGASRTTHAADQRRRAQR